MFMRFLMALATVFPLMTMSAQAREFRLEEFFKGRTNATASFAAITGEKRDFSVKLHGRWNGKTLTLREDFVFDDGERYTKTWRFTKVGWNTYRGTRDDVVGDTLVTVNGNKATFNYLVDIEEGPGENIVRFYDTMILSDDGKTVLNTAKVFKYGLPVAKVRVDFTR